MQIRFIRMIDELFKDAPHSRKTLELKEELVQNLIEKYRDLLSEGKSEDAAFDIACASIGDTEDLVEGLWRASGLARPEKPTAAPLSGERVEQSEPEWSQESFAQPEDSQAEMRHRSAVTTAVAVMMFILSPVPPILMGNAMGVTLLFVLLAAGTGLLVFSGMMKTRAKTAYGPQADDAQDFPERKKRKDGLSGAFWLLVTAAYILISFETGAWHISWVIFLFASALSSLASAFRGGSRKRVAGAVSGALWSMTTAIYFIISFATGAWHITWVIFLIAGALTNMVRSFAKAN